ncbi:MAG TPA: hypothetical protein VM052_00855 [Candidatus Limnocylindrales bacterium]|nr:hypothetical protein [Candidatus Limnocylindrales bacterium]
MDARPDSRVMAFAERRGGTRFQRFGTIRTSAVERENDGMSDRAVAQVVRERLFRRRTNGRFWHRVPFENLAELRRYLREHLRFAKRANWTVDAATRRRHANAPFVIRRAVRYELLLKR